MRQSFSESSASQHVTEDDGNCARQWRRLWPVNTLAPKAYRFLGEDNASFDHEILDITVAQIGSKVVPDRLADEIRWGYLAGIGGVCRYSSNDSSNLGKFSCQYPGDVPAESLQFILLMPDIVHAGVA